MKFSDFAEVAEVTQKALAQSMGAEYMERIGTLNPLDAGVLVDIGKDVTSGVTPSTDVFTKALISVIADIELMELSVTDELSYLFKKNFEWGGFVERVYYNLADVIEDPMYNLVNGRSYADIENRFYAPKVSAKIFDEAKAVAVPQSYAEDQLKEAFLGWDKMQVFVQGVRNSVRNTLRMVMKAYARVAVSVGIATAIKNGNVIHLMTEFYGEDYTTTVEEAKRDKAFLSYFSERITEIRDNMLTESTAFNNHSILASAENVDMVLLKSIERAIRFGLLADTYHKDVVALGDYSSVTTWQGVAETDGQDVTRFKFETVSKIMLDADPDNKLGLGTEAITIENCVAFLHDHRAIGCCPYRMKVTSNYVSCADFWNEFQHLLVNWICDSNCSMVAFLMD